MVVVTAMVGSCDGGTGGGGAMVVMAVMEAVVVAVGEFSIG